MISITDGQIFLQTELFNSGVRPAVDSGLSVSRVGSSAQTKIMKKVSGSLKLDLAQYRELLSFAQFGSDLDPVTKATIEHGARLTELLKQPQYSPMSMAEQVLSLFMANNGFLKEIELEDVKAYEEFMQKHFHDNEADLIKEIEDKGTLDDELNTRLLEGMKRAQENYLMINGK